MCVTHIYTDCYPKRTVEFHQTIVCPDAKDGISCPAHITNEHPPRTLESNGERSSKEYLDQGLKVPITSKPSTHKSTTTTTYRYSQGDKVDKSTGREPRLRLVRKKRALTSALTPRRKHPRERIVIVDAPNSPQGSKSLQKYASDSPTTEDFNSKNLLIANRPRRQESASPRRSPNRSLNPVRTVIVEQKHRDTRERSKERGRTLQDLPIILAPEPPSRSPSRERELLDMRIRREDEEREREHQREYERERERDEMRKVAEELERGRIRREKSEDERRREAEYKKFMGEKDREMERDREKETEVEIKRARDRQDEILREIERARSSERRREEEVSKEGERRRREEELRRADDHQQVQREEKHRREREKGREIEEKAREERMRKAEISERKAADDARRLAEQVKAFALEDEQIRRRPVVPGREKQERWKLEDEDMYSRLRKRQVRDEGLVGLGKGASFSGRGDGDRDRDRGRDGERGVLDRLKQRQKGPEEGYTPKRTTIGGGRERRRGEERIIWDEGEGGRSGRW